LQNEQRIDEELLVAPLEPIVAKSR
jgi:hypothetical protein